MKKALEVWESWVHVVVRVRTLDRVEAKERARRELTKRGYTNVRLDTCIEQEAAGSCLLSFNANPLPWSDEGGPE